MSDLKRDIKHKKTTPLVFKLPVPPSVNKIYYNTKGGGRRLTAEAERYITNTRAMARMVMEEQNWSTKSPNTWFYLDLAFKFPDRRIRDSHNCLKLLLDALEGICFQNDYFVMPRIQSVELDSEDPCVVINLTEQTTDERQLAIQKYSDEL